MILTMLLPPAYDARKWALAAQVGVTRVVTKAAPDLSGLPAPYDERALVAVKSRFADAGFVLHGLEGDQFDMSRIKLGLPGRDEDIERYRAMIRAMGRNGVRLLCYNFMASIGWYRTGFRVLERGGALASEFRIQDVVDQPHPEGRTISEAGLWKNIEYFLKSVLPVAEEEGVTMALHPDDPPVSPLRGVDRVLINAAAFDRVTAIEPSSANQIAFCQATFLAMGEDIVSLSARWLRDDRIAFVHLRDVIGTRECFRETFHDNGPTDMAYMLRHYHAHGYCGAIRPDHSPAMFGEDDGGQKESIGAGYQMTGRVFAAGYIRGICDASDIRLE